MTQIEQAQKVALHTDQVTSRVKVTDILPGDPPAILTVERAVNSSGAVRHFTQKVPVCDANLFRRLSSEVNKGDEITVTIVTEWYEADYTSCLADYSLLPQNTAAPAAALSGRV